MSMAKMKSKWVCTSCNYTSASFLGRCPDCGEFSTFVEEFEEKQGTIKNQQNAIRFQEVKYTKLTDEAQCEKAYIPTGFEEFDRVLGRGYTTGSLTLLAGDPGIGKSTLLLQTMGHIANSGMKVLYICAEESTNQVKQRAKRLKIETENLYLSSENCLENVISLLDEIKPEFLVIDSIQSIFTSIIEATIGTVSQIRESTNILMKIAKQKNITTTVIGHVTKDGNIAGPKVLEHMVDCVINFEGDKYKTYRTLRTIKNRFGSTNEIAVFEMLEDGLQEVKNLSEIFLKDREEQNSAGTTIVPILEGTKTLLLELQALTGATPYPQPRRVARGVDYNRLLQILAVLEKKVGLNLSHHDVYVNIIGGIQVNEPAIDLACAIAIIASHRDIIVPYDCVFIGEIGLTGEIRYVTNLEKRLLEAKKLGFKKAIIPKTTQDIQKKLSDIELEIVPVKNLTEAILKGLKN